MKLIASMVVSNELSRYLTLAVEHLRTFCDEVRVLDDFSSDGTYEWLLDQDGVYTLTNPGPTFYEYESRARQALLEWTMEGKPDYVLSIDADEFVGDPEALKRCMQTGGEVFTLSMQEVWKADDRLHIRTDGLWKPRLCPILWKAPSELTSEWDIPDRKLACGREPMRVRRTRFQRSGSDVFHFGWAKESERETRFARYMEHDKGNFHADKHLQSIMWGPDRVRTNPARWPRGLYPIRHQIINAAS